MTKNECNHDTPGIATYEGFSIYDSKLHEVTHRRAIFIYPCGCSVRWVDGELVDDE